MKRIGVISDIHGNLPALVAALQYLENNGCQEIIHTGDVISIGPQSRECLQLVLEKKIVCLMGNHDLDFVHGSAVHKRDSHVAAQHKQQVFDSIREFRKDVEKFPYFAERLCGGKKVIFEHYCRMDHLGDNGEPFVRLKPYPALPDVNEMDQNYASYNCDVVFYGHQHRPSEVQGKRLYVDVGSVGCHPQPLATGLIISFDDKNFSYQRFAVPYDQQSVKKMMLERVADGEYLFERYFMANVNNKSKYF